MTNHGQKQVEEAAVDVRPDGVLLVVHGERADILVGGRDGEVIGPEHDPAFVERLLGPDGQLQPLTDIHHEALAGILYRAVSVGDALDGGWTVDLLLQPAPGIVGDVLGVPGPRAQPKPVQGDVWLVRLHSRCRRHHRLLRP